MPSIKIITVPIGLPLIKFTKSDPAVIRNPY